MKKLSVVYGGSTVGKTTAVTGLLATPYNERVKPFGVCLGQVVLIDTDWPIENIMSGFIVRDGLWVDKGEPIHRAAWRHWLSKAFHDSRKRIEQVLAEMVVGLAAMASVSKVCVVTNFHSTAWDRITDARFARTKEDMMDAWIERERQNAHAAPVRPFPEWMKTYQPVEGATLLSKGQYLTTKQLRDIFGLSASAKVTAELF